MQKIDQLYATHCTSGTSAIERAEGRAANDILGYSARASSVSPPELRQHYNALKRYLNYYLPPDAPKNLTAQSAPRRLFFCPSSSGMQVLGQVCYRQKATDGRVGSYFAHLLTGDGKNGAWDVIDCLKLWGASGWRDEDPDFNEVKWKLEPTSFKKMTNGDPPLDYRVILHERLELPAPLPPLPPPPPGTGNATASLRSRFKLSRRSKFSAEQWRLIFRRALEGYMEVSRVNRGCMLLVAEPSTAVLSFYLIARLLPAKLRQEISFSTFEVESQKPKTRLVATRFHDEAHDVSQDRRRQDFVVNTFAPDHDLEQPPPGVCAAYVELVWGELESESGGWDAVDRIVDAASEAATLEHLESCARDGEPEVQGLLDPDKLPGFKFASWKPTRVVRAYEQKRAMQRLAGKPDTSVLEKIASRVEHCQAILDLVAGEASCKDAVNFLLQRACDVLSRDRRERQKGKAEDRACTDSKRICNWIVRDKDVRHEFQDLPYKSLLEWSSKHDPKQMFPILSDTQIREALRANTEKEIFKELPKDDVIAFLSHEHVPERCVTRSVKYLPGKISSANYKLRPTAVPKGVRLSEPQKIEVENVVFILRCEKIKKARRRQLLDPCVEGVANDASLVYFFDHPVLDSEIKTDVSPAHFARIGVDRDQTEQNYNAIKWFLAGRNVPTKCKNDAWEELKTRLVANAPRDAEGVISFLTDMANLSSTGVVPAAIGKSIRLEVRDSLLGNLSGKEFVEYLTHSGLDDAFKLNIDRKLYRKIPNKFGSICSFIGGTAVPEQCKQDAWEELEPRLAESAPDDVDEIIAFFKNGKIEKARKLDVRDQLLENLDATDRVKFFEADLDEAFKLGVDRQIYGQVPKKFDTICSLLRNVPQADQQDALKALRQDLLDTAPKNVQKIVSFLRDKGFPSKFRLECRDELLKRVPGDQLKSFFAHDTLDKDFKLGVDESVYRQLPDGIAKMHGFLCAAHIPLPCKSDAWKVFKSRLASGGPKSEVEANQAEGVKQIQQFLRNGQVANQFRTDAVNALLAAVPPAQLLDVLSDTGISSDVKKAVSADTYARIPANPNKDIIDYLQSDLPAECKLQAGRELGPKIDEKHLVRFLVLTGVDVQDKNQALDRHIAQLPLDKQRDILQDPQIPVGCKLHGLPTFAAKLDPPYYDLILDLEGAELPAKEEILNRQCETLKEKRDEGEISRLLRSLYRQEELGRWKTEVFPKLAKLVDTGSLEAFFELDAVDWEFKKELLALHAQAINGERVFQLLENPNVDHKTKRHALEEHCLWKEIPPGKFHQFLKLDEGYALPPFKTKLIHHMLSGEPHDRRTKYHPEQMVPFLERIPEKYQNVAARYYLDEIPREHFFRFLALKVDQPYKDHVLDRFSILIEEGKIPAEDFNKLLGLDASCLSDEIKIQAVRHYVEKNEDMPPTCQALWTEARDKNRRANWPPNLLATLLTDLDAPKIEALAHKANKKAERNRDYLAGFLIRLFQANRSDLDEFRTGITIGKAFDDEELFQDVATRLDLNRGCVGDEVLSALRRRTLLILNRVHADPEKYGLRIKILDACQNLFSCAPSDEQEEKSSKRLQAWLEIDDILHRVSEDDAGQRTSPLRDKTLSLLALEKPDPFDKEHYELAVALKTAMDPGLEAFAGTDTLKKVDFIRQIAKRIPTAKDFLHKNANKKFQKFFVGKGWPSHAEWKNRAVSLLKPAAVLVCLLAAVGAVWLIAKHGIRTGPAPVPPSFELSVDQSKASESSESEVKVKVQASRQVVSEQTFDLIVEGNNITESDYELPKQITIPGGSLQGEVQFKVKNDDAWEKVETAVVKISNPTTGKAIGTATIEITDDDLPTVSIVADPKKVTEGAGIVQFVVSIKGGAPAPDDLAIQYKVEGSAKPDSDYDKLGDSLTILAGQSSKTFNLTVLEDEAVEGDETVILNLQRDDRLRLESGSAQLVIKDDDEATVSINPSEAEAQESDTWVPFTFQISDGKRAGDKGIEVTYAQRSSGRSDEPVTKKVTIPPGEDQATVHIDVKHDDIVEKDEIVQLKITDTNNSRVKPADGNKAELKIADDDRTTTVSITAKTPTVSEAGSQGQFEIKLDGEKVAGPGGIDVSYDVAGTADKETDYEKLSGRVTIPAGAKSVTINVNVNGERKEDDKTIQLTVTGTNAGVKPAAAPDNTATLTITKAAKPDPPPKKTGGDEFATAQTVSLQQQRTYPLKVVKELQTNNLTKFAAGQVEKLEIHALARVNSIKCEKYDEKSRAWSVPEQFPGRLFANAQIGLGTADKLFEVTSDHLRKIGASGRRAQNLAGQVELILTQRLQGLEEKTFHSWTQSIAEYPTGDVDRIKMSIFWKPGFSMVSNVGNIRSLRLHGTETKPGQTRVPMAKNSDWELRFDFDAERGVISCHRYPQLVNEEVKAAFKAALAETIPRLYSCVLEARLDTGEERLFSLRRPLEPQSDDGCELTVNVPLKDGAEVCFEAQATIDRNNRPVPIPATVDEDGQNLRDTYSFVPLAQEFGFADLKFVAKAGRTGVRIGAVTAPPKEVKAAFGEGLHSAVMDQITELTAKIKQYETQLGQSPAPTPDEVASLQKRTMVLSVWKTKLEAFTTAVTKFEVKRLYRVVMIGKRRVFVPLVEPK